MAKRKTAGELSLKASQDTTKYDALEVGYAISDDIGVHLRECIENHKNIIDEVEFCVVVIIAKDNILKNVMRRKFYCWPYLPSPRPNQSVFLYNKHKDDIIKRLWVLPNDQVMAELCSLAQVDKKYFTMKKWSDAFFHGWVNKPYINEKGERVDKWVNTTPSHFFNVIRKQHNIRMPSEHEYILANREKLMQAGCKEPGSGFSDAFDFSKIHIKNFVDPSISEVEQNVV